MSLGEAVALVAAGMFAGTINAVVGSGTLVTFPTLLFFGHPPVVASISNNLGLVPGGVAGTWGYRSELTGFGATVRRYLPMSVAGAVVGALLLLVLPGEVFAAVVPVLIIVAVVLVLAGTRLQRWAAARHTENADLHRDRLLRGGLLLSGVYGGYFGAAQGILMMGLMSVLSSEPLHRLNATKNALSTAVNAVAALVFLAVAWSKVDWTVVAAISAGSLVGGYVGGRVGRRISPAVLRALITVIGLVAVVRLLFFA